MTKIKVPDDLAKVLLEETEIINASRIGQLTMAMKEKQHMEVLWKTIFDNYPEYKNSECNYDATTNELIIKYRKLDSELIEKFEKLKEM